MNFCKDNYRTASKDSSLLWEQYFPYKMSYCPESLKWVASDDESSYTLDKNGASSSTANNPSRLEFLASPCDSEGSNINTADE
ncbi:hypothetical protein F8388_008508 [Cannabis sativa]|uniref:Uncharacterized protein n=1 Tax=Cannabis sativa TaxID=3483 RepID=A0A7J6EJX9_CANSA|nr:hypothetical protein F8388_008508 [Cannabis sativa]KAF4404375.1 hypothetical protein G4B88_014831 [Cannabis sativa]